MSDLMDHELRAREVVQGKAIHRIVSVNLFINLEIYSSRYSKILLGLHILYLRRIFLGIMLACAKD